tara:strand:+ start:47 stop:1150 length:1104 start_codon:yes stop_codon:yes gene_type:complete
MIKVLYTIPNFDTAGSGKALLNVAKTLDKKKFTPIICCSHDRGKFFKVVNQSNIPVYIHQTTHNMIPRVEGVFKCLKLAKFFKKLGVDVIHSFHYGADYSEALAAKFARIPWVYTKKNMNWGGYSKNGWKLRTLFAKHILAQNTDMFKEFFPKSKKVSLVPRGVDIDEFKPREKNNRLLKKYNIKENEKIIVCVANLHPVKGIETLLYAFKSLLNKIDNFHLFIVGEKENSYGEFLQKKVQHLSNIHFTGKVYNVVDYYSIANIFVLPTIDKGRREGCPVALLEALASGLDVIASDVPGIRDVLNNFPFNLFQPGDSTELSKKIFKLINNNSFKINSSLLSHVRKNYNIGVEARKHEKIYEKLLSNK